jgi:hypothetical protein
MGCDDLAIVSGELSQDEIHPLGRKIKVGDPTQYCESGYTVVISTISSRQSVKAVGDVNST